MPQVSTMILAAGAGRRIGQPKLFLPMGDRDFLAEVIASLPDAARNPLVIIVRSEHLAIVQPRYPSATVLVNQDPERGMLSSVQLGCASLAEFCSGALLFPVDHPHVQPATVAALLASHALSPDTIIKPSYHQQSGHPILLPQLILKQLASEIFDDNLQEWLRKQNCVTHFCEVNDPGILKNINTPDNLAE